MKLKDKFYLNVVNHNDRLYPVKVMRRAINDANIVNKIEQNSLYAINLDDTIREHLALISLYGGSPCYFEKIMQKYSLENNAFLIKSLTIVNNSDDPYLEIEVITLNNENGQSISDELKSKYPDINDEAIGSECGFRLMPIGTAEMENNTDGIKVLKYYNLITFDFIWDNGGWLK